MIFGRPNIRKLKIKGDAAGLIRALEYNKDENIQRQAVKALGDLRVDAALDSLLRLLDDPQWPDPEGVIEALGEIGSGRAVQPLISRVKKQGAYSSPGELAALRRIGRESIDPLLSLLEKKSFDTKDSTAVLAELEAIGGERVSAGLVELIDKGNPSLLPHLADILGRMGDKKALPALTAVLKTGAAESWGAQIAAVMKDLGWVPADAAERAALFLAERDWDRLKGVGLPALDILLPLLRKGRASEIQKTIEILNEIGDRRAVEPVSALLDDRRPEIVVAAVRTLGRLGGSATIEPLLQMISDSDSPTLAKEAEKALIRIGPPAVQGLIGHLKSVDPRVRKTVVRLLGEIGDENALPHLILAREDPSLSPELKTALEKLGWEPDPSGES